MTDFLDEQVEAKKASLGFKGDALKQLVLLRYQALITISSISFAVAGLVISMKGGLIQHEGLSIFAGILFIGVALVSLGMHLYLLRTDIESMVKKIESLPNEDWGKPLEHKPLKVDWWPEILYAVLVTGIILFGLSLCPS